MRIYLAEVLKEAYLVLWSSYWFGEAEERQCEVDEAILEGLQFLVAIGDLEQLQTDQAHHQRGCRGDGWDDLTSNALTLSAYNI